MKIVTCIHKFRIYGKYTAQVVPCNLRYPWATVLNVSKIESILFIQNEENGCKVRLFGWDPGSSELSIVVLLYGVFRS